MMRKIKLAVLGLNHGYTFAKDIMTLTDVELVAVAGNDALAKERAAALGVPLYKDFKELIDSCDLDGVIITLPNQLHLEAVRSCADRSVDVLVEKPIASTVDEGLEIVRVAREAGIRLLVGHHRRFSSKVARLKELITDEEIGKLIGVNMLFTLAKNHAYFNELWRISAAAGGPLLINGVHDIDTIRFVTGLSINRVFAASQNCIRGNEVEDTASVLLETDEGVMINYFVTDGVPAPWSYEFTTGENPKYPHYSDENCYHFLGTKGSIAFPSMKMYTYSEAHYGWNHPLNTEQFEVEDNDPMKAELLHFVSVLKGEAAPFVTGEDALETLKVVLAIKQSAQEKRIIEID